MLETIKISTRGWYGILMSTLQQSVTTGRMNSYIFTDIKWCSYHIAE